MCCLACAVPWTRECRLACTKSCDRLKSQLSQSSRYSSGAHAEPHLLHVVRDIVGHVREALSAGASHLSIEHTRRMTAEQRQAHLFLECGVSERSSVSLQTGARAQATTRRKGRIAKRESLKSLNVDNNSWHKRASICLTICTTQDTMSALRGWRTSVICTAFYS